MTSDGLLAPTDIEDALAQVYVAAVAAKAGYVTTRKDFDRDGIDLTVEAGGHMRPKLDIQLKATINLPEIGDAGDRLSYPCPRRNYDLLRLPTQTPRILVVLHLPRDRSEWLTIRASDLILRYCAYWISLSHHPELEAERQGKSVHLLKENRLDDVALGRLMDKSRSGKIA